MAAGTGFPYVLYDLLKKESSMVVMWTSTGTAFGIRDMTSFRQDVLTCYFKHNKFSSFQRQLNLYGFRKVVKGRESGCYMHPSFLRDHPEKLTEVKRGVVPPCPPHYSRKIYGSGPRFMNQDDGSDSEPELVVQPRGHWDKSLGPSEMVTHMRLGDMHISAAALAAARAQIKAEGAAAAHQMQVTQAQMIGGGPGLPGDGHNGQSMSSVGHMGRQPVQSNQCMSPMGFMNANEGGAVGLGVGMGGGGGGGGGGNTSAGGGSSTGGEGNRGRTPRNSLSKMFGLNRPPTVSGSMYSGGGGNGGGGVGRPPGGLLGGHGSGGVNRDRSPQHSRPQLPRFNSLPPPAHSSLEPQSTASRANQMGSGGHTYLPPLLATVQNNEGGPLPMPGSGGGGSGGSGMGEGGLSKEGGEMVGHRPHASTAVSLSRLLDGLGQTLDAPLEEEMYTPIDKRNSFCAQMMNIAQVLEDDPSMQVVEESKSSQISYLAQKRRSSVSELAAYLRDMLEDGESTRMPSNVWVQPAPPGEGLSGGRDGPNGSLHNRVTFKRSHGDDGEGYGDSFILKTASGGSNEEGQGDEGGVPERGLSRAFSKRARGSPISPSNATDTDAGDCGNRPERRRSENGERRMSEARRIASVGPTVVQALTCLASGLKDGSADSDDSNDDRAARQSTFESDERRPTSSWGSPRCEKHNITIKQEGSTDRTSSRGDKASGDSKAGSESVIVKLEEARSMMSRNSSGVGNSGECDVDGEIHSPGIMPQHVRRGSNPIADVLTNFSIDRALEQFKPDGSGNGGGGDERGGGEQGDAGGHGEQQGRQRASVYVLMHAIAAVDTANELQTSGEEVLEGEVATVSAAI